MRQHGAWGRSRCHHFLVSCFLLYFWCLHFVHALSKKMESVPKSRHISSLCRLLILCRLFGLIIRLYLSFTSNAMQYIFRLVNSIITMMSDVSHRMEKLQFGCDKLTLTAYPLLSYFFLITFQLYCHSESNV